MSKEFTLKAESRDRVGKGSSRALRRNGLIPAVIYGEKQAPLAIALPFKPVHLHIYAGGFMTKVLIIEYGQEKIRVLPRDYQLDPVKDTPLHVDFLRISEKSRVTVEVPVHFLNQEDCIGLKAGGSLNIIRHTVEMEVLASAIPEYIEVDIAAAEIGDSIHISSAKIPAGAQLTVQDRNFTLATISAPLEEEEEAATEPSAEPAESEAKEPEAKKDE